jgi:aspartate racemase
MRKLGLIGGMSWASTAIYYEKINRGVRLRLGGHSNAPLILESLDFDPIAKALAAGEWGWLGEHLADAAKRLEQSGAEGIMLCSNTMHKLYDRVASAVSVPVLHVADATVAAIRADGVHRAALLGTRFTMREGFLRERLQGQGVTLSMPEPERMAEIDRIIFDELVQGDARVESKRTMRTVIAELQKAGDEAVVLGCAELALIINPTSNVLPIYDTTGLHAEAALEWVLDEPIPAHAMAAAN